MKNSWSKDCSEFIITDESTYLETFFNRILQISLSIVNIKRAELRVLWIIFQQLRTLNLDCGGKT